MERTNEERFPRTIIPKETRAEIRKAVSDMITFLESKGMAERMGEEIIKWTIVDVVHRNMERDAKTKKLVVDQDLLNVMNIAFVLDIPVFQLLKKN